MRIIGILIFMLLIQLVSAQEVSVSGKVYYISSSELTKVETGASVRIKNTNWGTISDLEGNYNLTCHIGDTLKVVALGTKSIEWVVEDTKLPKDFYLQDYYVSIGGAFYRSASNKHAFSLLSTYAPELRDIGMSLGYTYSFDNYFFDNIPSIDGYRPRPNNLLSAFSLSATYVRPTFKNEALFYPQLVYNYHIPFKIIKRYRPLMVSAGMGYYWHVNDGFNFNSGNAVLSANLQYRYKRMVLRGFRLDFVGGYNWFIKNKQDNHFSLGIVVYPFSKMRF